MRGRRGHKRGTRAVDVAYTVGIVTPFDGVIVTDVTSNSTVTQIGDTWVIAGQWTSTTQVEDNSEVEPL